MAECRRCTRKSDLFLCGACTGELKRLLADLPWWLDRLAETAVGQVRLGEKGGRRRHKTGLERYADPKPAIDGKGGTEGQRRLEADLRERAFTRWALSQGGVNGTASELFDEVQNMLGTWVRDVCERRGIFWVPATFIGPLRANEERETVRTASAAARWLRDRVSALASAECAMETFTDIKDAQQKIERAVNRAPEPRTCGPCPTPGNHGEKGFRVDYESRSTCNTRLEADPAAVEVYCPVCKQTHNVELLTNRLLNQLHYMSFTRRELLDAVLPKAQLSIPKRTLYDWIAKGNLKPSGYTEDGTPRYLLADVRSLRIERRSA